MPQDLSVGKLPKELTEADIVILNMLDFLDNPEDLDPASFQRQMIIDLGVMMKRGSKLFVITQDLEDMKIPNIKKNYTVTDKADGDRKMLFINDVGNIYLIDTNMNLTFTGAKTTNSDRFMSLLDGEHIKCDKNNKVINLYAAFDLYYINKKSIRDYPFVYSEDDELLENLKTFKLFENQDYDLDFIISNRVPFIFFVE